MDRGFWKDKSVLVTGHTGFKGAWLSLCLKHLGARIVGYSLPPPTEPSFFELANVAQGIDSEIGDVRALESLRQCLARHQPEIVFHLAAQSLVRMGYEDPIVTYETNVMGTLNLLEAVRTCASVKSLVNVTSDKCYQNEGTNRPFREDDRLGGRDPYSNSKACAELVTTAYTQSFFSSPDSPAVATARAGNVLGGGDWGRDRLVPDIVRAALDGNTAVIRNPDSTRPWQHVLDCLNGYVTLAESVYGSSGPAGAWNFGPVGEVKTVAWVVDHLVDRWPGHVDTKIVRDPDLIEAPMLSVDPSKAISQLDWTPRLGIEKTLEWVIEWHYAVSKGDDGRGIAIEQIDRFLRED
jgi:CDP-glucose 4,6-dehydratase